MNNFKIPVMPNLDEIECVVEIDEQTFKIQEDDTFLSGVISLLGDFQENHNAIDTAKKCIDLIDDSLGNGTVAKLASDQEITAERLLDWIYSIIRAIMSKKEEVKRLANEYIEQSNKYIKKINEYIRQKYE